MKARAKTLDGDIVDGMYEYMPPFVAKEEYHAISWYVQCSQHGYDVMEEEINPTTLEYQIGDEWYSMKNLELMAKLVHSGMDAHMEGKTRVVYMDKNTYGAYMDWSMQNGYR